LVVWEIAEHFHWTLEYVEGLTLYRLKEWFAIVEGRSAGMAERQRRDAFLHGGKGKKGRR